MLRNIARGLMRIICRVLYIPVGCIAQLAALAGIVLLSLAALLFVAALISGVLNQWVAVCWTFIVTYHWLLLIGLASWPAVGVLGWLGGIEGGGGGKLPEYTPKYSSSEPVWSPPNVDDWSGPASNIGTEPF